MDGDPQIFMAADKTALRFYIEPAKNNFQSEAHGRVVYDSVLYAEVMTPGSTSSAPCIELERTFCAEAGIEIPRRSARYAQYEPQIEAYKSQSKENLVQGVPITHWPQIDVALAATLKAARIFTVEQLAALPDSALGVVGIGGHGLRAQAQAYLAPTGETSELVARIARLEQENKMLQETVGKLQGGAGTLAVEQPKEEAAALSGLAGATI